MWLGNHKEVVRSPGDMFCLYQLMCAFPVGKDSPGSKDNYLEPFHGWWYFVGSAWMCSIHMHTHDRLQGCDVRRKVLRKKTKRCGLLEVSWILSLRFPQTVLWIRVTSELQRVHAAHTELKLFEEQCKIPRRLLVWPSPEVWQQTTKVHIGGVPKPSQAPSTESRG